MEHSIHLFIFRSGVAGKCLDLAGTDGTQYPPFVPKVCTFGTNQKSKYFFII